MALTLTSRATTIFRPQILDNQSTLVQAREEGSGRTCPAGLQWSRLGLCPRFQLGLIPRAHFVVYRGSVVEIGAGDVPARSRVQHQGGRSCRHPRRVDHIAVPVALEPLLISRIVVDEDLHHRLLLCLWRAFRQSSPRSARHLHATGFQPDLLGKSQQHFLSLFNRLTCPRIKLL